MHIFMHIFVVPSRRMYSMQVHIQHGQLKSLRGQSGMMPRSVIWPLGLHTRTCYEHMHVCTHAHMHAFAVAMYALQQASVLYGTARHFIARGRRRSMPDSEAAARWPARTAPHLRVRTEQPWNGTAGGCRRSLRNWAAPLGWRPTCAQRRRRDQLASAWGSEVAC